MTAINGIGLTCPVLSRPTSDIVPEDPQRSAVLLGLYHPRQGIVLSLWWLGFPSVGIGNPEPPPLETSSLVSTSDIEAKN